jgi:hypothetical protein
MESLPAYVSIVFILTTFATVGFLLQTAKAAGMQSLPTRILLFVLPLWIVFQAVLAIGGFYQDSASRPPRILVLGVLPSLAFIGLYFIFFRVSFIERLPLKLLTILHVIRIPVEIVLLWLFIGNQVPQMMTFEGRYFDILSGILAPIVYFLVFRGGALRGWILIVYNILGLILLANIVSIAVMSLPSPLQQMAFDQPNRAVLFFPYISLPTIVVPIVLFSHIAALWKIAKGKTGWSGS